MTKYVRIENADMANFKVKVDVQDRVYDHEKQVMTDEWKTIKTIDLDHPTALANEFLTDSRRFIVREEKAST